VGLLISWATIAAGLWASDKLLDGFKIKGGIGSFLLVAAVFGVLNFLLGWLVFGLIGIASLGLGFLFAFLTRLVVAALMLKLADAVSSRLEIRSFKVAFFAACIMALASFAVDWIMRR
jgi:putative membrane protein